MNDYHYLSHYLIDVNLIFIIINIQPSIEFRVTEYLEVRLPMWSEVKWRSYIEEKKKSDLDLTKYLRPLDTLEKPYGISKMNS